MNYSFKEPKTLDMKTAVWDMVKNKWYFWIPAIFLLILYYELGFVFIVVYIVIIFVKVQQSFWKEFALVNGWEYKKFNNFLGTRDVSLNEESLMLRQGQSQAISNEIIGTISNRDFKIFCYRFYIGVGKTKRAYHYTVFSFESNGTFPHIYLNNKKNSYNINIGEKIKTPKEFEDKFSISVARNYEIEALQIFTHDVLATLLDIDFPYDVEFINQEILIFTDGQIHDFADLKFKFNKSLELMSLLFDKFDKFRFEKIGKSSYVLK
jgi:hypothetical protein